MLNLILKKSTLNRSLSLKLLTFFISFLIVVLKINIPEGGGTNARF
jgi:hypothetical protein